MSAEISSGSTVAERPAWEQPSLGRKGAPVVELAARRIVQAILDGDSAFSPGTPVWTSAHANELMQHFVGAPKYEGGDFQAKLVQQLAGVSDGARMLFAELSYLNVLPLADYKPETKRGLVAKVLAHLHPVELQTDIDEAFDGWVFNGGVAFKTRRYFQLCVLVRMASDLLQRSPSERAELLSDPWKFRDLLKIVSRSAEPAQGRALLYLFFPGTFLPIVGLKQLEAIRMAFASRIGGPTGDLDRDLMAIYSELCKREGAAINFYASPHVEVWRDPQPPHEESDLEPDVLPRATDALAAGLHIDRGWLQECIDLLVDRPQLIFYGPPGTGKTYVALALAEHIAGENVKLVQFHPAYSYEDFFEGFRPTAAGEGNVGFELKPGPLRKLVADAQANQDQPHVLIIDEINRGNLAKIFGELYFLLEYREHEIDLLYSSGSSEGFSLPSNVFIIGTMNTADRSIALVDAAMRRRFAFLPLHPAEDPTRGVLRRWLAKSNLPTDAADLLDELNERIGDPDFKIGPSYFMREAVHQSGGLERVWRTAILPLLEEHHYGDSVDVKAIYGYEVIRDAAVQPRQAADAANH